MKSPDPRTRCKSAAGPETKLSLRATPGRDQGATVPFAAPPSVLMPRAKTELGELLANDPLLCVRRLAASKPARSVAAGGPAPMQAAADAQTLAEDPNLARLIAAWPSLPGNIRAAIAALVPEEAGVAAAGDQA